MFCFLPFLFFKDEGLWQLIGKKVVWELGGALGKRQDKGKPPEREVRGGLPTLRANWVPPTLPLPHKVDDQNGLYGEFQHPSL